MSQQSYSLKEIADQLSLTLIGDGDCVVGEVAPLGSAKPGQISFLCDEQYRTQLSSTQASAVLLSKKYKTDCPTNALVADNPQLALVALLQLLYPESKPKTGIHPSAVVGASSRVDATASVAANAVIGERAEIGPGVIIGAGCVVDEGAKIGADSILHANVTILAASQLGERVIVHSGAVIGSDGFGNALNEKRQWVKVPQLGSVRIGNDVEIGANTTIDRGALADTVIEDGVRLDNQIQIAHNVKIGAHTAIAGCVGIAGSTTIGKHCMVGGGTCINGHLTICDGAFFTGMSMVTKSVESPGVYSSGIPAMPNREWRYQVARLKQLNTMVKRLTALEREHND